MDIKNSDTGIAAATQTPAGRFAPSPTGRMHLGNVFTALLSWLSVRKAGGRWILRIEDLDPQRSREEYARQIEDDLLWLGLEWDEGGLDDRGDAAPYRQSLRGEIYETYLRRLESTGYTYPCVCTRADIMATQAPHQSDGRVIYGGRCRPAKLPCVLPAENLTVRHAVRLYVPEDEICFSDRVYGQQRVSLATECGDFVLRRADGAWAYQLAVVVDDALMGVTEVVRGNDLLLSAAQQIYLYRLLGLQPPSYAHLPLLCNQAGQRLSKRDSSLSMDRLREAYSPERLVGYLAWLAGLQPEPHACRPDDLIEAFDWNCIRAGSTINVNVRAVSL
ncbi:tRNA glutamyl-Q(34) synthetase GluQRS [Duncaniella sp.]|uniref:tRNA glutamyl-Q(34) synthetase GluQRS n=1 Tax=Duncaniella sp. TaxID=2518496 RepID=UPI0023D73D6A|nr:tRNA glutamyl-Q(34) synthetase GluQRS [Duncaniella sp.]MDE5905369.1 tRNA glutamyl-Q(34) synthetase GluQRS [Duncaniella sp.]